MALLNLSQLPGLAKLFLTVKSLYTLSIWIIWKSPFVFSRLVSFLFRSLCSYQNLHSSFPDFSPPGWVKNRVCNVLWFTEPFNIYHPIWSSLSSSIHSLIHKTFVKHPLCQALTQRTGFQGYSQEFWFSGSSQFHREIHLYSLWCVQNLRFAQVERQKRWKWLRKDFLSRDGKETQGSTFTQFWRRQGSYLGRDGKGQGGGDTSSSLTPWNKTILVLLPSSVALLHGLRWVPSTVYKNHLFILWNDSVN